MSQDPATSFDDWLVWMNTQARQRDLQLEDGRALRFVAHDALPRAVAYERWIAQTACVPTRNNLHDRLNAWVWLHLPRFKARLNAIQALWLERLGTHGPRGVWRDWATLMDESGALVLDASPGSRLVMALQTRHWQDAFVRHREDWHHGRVVRLMGHALLEKGLAPYKSMTAHAWVLRMPEGAQALTWSEVDALALAASPLPEETLSLSPPQLLPLPVLGVPGWWPGNEAPDFYTDEQVFRPRRAARMMAVDSGSDDRC